MTTSDPLTEIRRLHRETLDHQAQLAIQARALADAARTVTADIAETAANARIYAAIINAITTTPNPPSTTTREAKA